MKICYLILVGPKGSGKTTIGNWIAQEFSPNASFVDVELAAKDFLNGRPFSQDLLKPMYEAMEVSIQEHATRLLHATPSQASNEQGPLVIFETTGAAENETLNLIENLRQRNSDSAEDHGVVMKLVRIRAAADTCHQRIITRDASRQIPCSQELIDKIHRLVEALDWAWDLELDNTDLLSRDSVKEQIQNLLLQSSL